MSLPLSPSEKHSKHLSQTATAQPQLPYLLVASLPSSFDDI
jgi:hypothetical protein